MEPVITDAPFEEMDGPVLLLAGPGTGKTYQLAKRIQSLVDVHGVDPQEIMVITFTREAAQGMRNKINEQGKAEYIEPTKRPKNILTMHSLGHRIIEENAAKIGLKPGVQVVSGKELKGCLMRDSAFLIGLTEEQARTALRDKETANTSPSPESSRIQTEYKKILQSCNAIDFDDQISIASDILQENSEILDKYKAITKHLLVDEYQDINSDQHRFITLLTKGQTKGLFAVGDDDQSIYGFRGGDPSFIRSFAANYSGAKVLQLQVSRRCLKNILDCAVVLVTKFDSERTPKAAPEYTSEEPGIVKIWNCPSDGRQAELIAKAIYAKSANGEAEDFLVLVPNRNYAMPVAKALKNIGVEHTIGTSGVNNEEWERLSIIRSWLIEPSNLLTRQVIEYIVSCGVTGMPSIKVRKAELKKGRSAHCQEIANLWSPVIDGKETLIGSLNEAAKSSEMLAALLKIVGNIKQGYESDDIALFLDTLRTNMGLFKSIKDFYLCLKRLEDKQDGVSEKGKVRVLTYQSSKGLEADCVFVVGLEEGSIPRNVADTKITAEEARLLFVAMTRAKKELHLMHARLITGSITYKAVSRQLKPSPFLASLPTSQSVQTYVQPASKKS
jgi:superfamily I DNA/RNA helicase